MDILLIEDEPEVALFIKKGLTEHQHRVTVVGDGIEGAKIASEQNFDLLILDIMLPGYDGFKVSQKVRTSNKEIPILMLTALGTIKDKLQGFESGADDYLTKPFHFEELLVRINALTRRRTMAPGKAYKAGDLELDSNKRTALRGGKEIELTTTEFTLLEILIANKNKVLSRSEITREVWGINFNRGTNLIDVYINYLRVKIDKDYTEKHIQTVIGQGYVLKEL